MQTEFVVTAGEQPKRLDVFLANHERDISRSALQRLIDRIDMKFEKSQLGKRVVSEPIAAEISLKSSGEESAGPVNRGDTI